MKTYPIRLDQTRQLAFSSNQLRLLDKELGREYGKGMAYFLQNMDPRSVRDGAVDLRFDILVLALTHGLREAHPGLTEERVCEWIDASEAPETDLWAAVCEAYLEERGMGLELPEEGGPEGNGSRPTSEAETSPATSAPS